MSAHTTAKKLKAKKKGYYGHDNYSCTREYTSKKNSTYFVFHQNQMDSSKNKKWVGMTGYTPPQIYRQTVQMYPGISSGK